MICPKCRAEYRRGFTECADCGVALVEPAKMLEEGAANSENAAAPGDPNEDPFCSFWKGNDPRIHAELCTVLDEVEVPHKTVFRQDHLFNLANYASFEVGVPASLFEKAEVAVKEAFEPPDPTESKGGNELLPVRLIPEMPERIRKLPPMLSPPERENLPGPAEPGEAADTFTEDATAEVWCGEDKYVSEMLLASLHENDIRVRQELISEEARLFVSPEDEERAKEIVREILEGQPPE
jgi:hypothetical protein